jgi:hypothetical protein
MYFFLFLLPLFSLGANVSSPQEIAAFRSEEDLIAGLVSPLTGL